MMLPVVADSESGGDAVNVTGVGCDKVEIAPNGVRLSYFDVENIGVMLLSFLLPPGGGKFKTLRLKLPRADRFGRR
jgi:hypothetical protein